MKNKHLERVLKELLRVMQYSCEDPYDLIVLNAYLREAKGLREKRKLLNRGVGNGK